MKKSNYGIFLKNLYIILFANDIYIEKIKRGLF